MENYGYNMIGEMLIGLGKALQDEESQLLKEFPYLVFLLGVVEKGNG